MEETWALPSEKDVLWYEEHGWWISPEIVDHTVLDEAWFSAERYYAGEHDFSLLRDIGTGWTPSDGDVLRQNDYVSLQMEEIGRLVRHPVVAATAARLARTPSVRLFHDQLVYKPPARDRDQTRVGWHTDIAYWKTCSSRNMITAWIPFEDVTIDMGPMEMFDGSHRWEGGDSLATFHDADGANEAMSRLRAGSSEPTPIVLRKGQVSFHHCMTIHGGRNNLSTVPRVALAVHMQDDANHYVSHQNADGREAAHLTDALCRRDENGRPDYRDADVFPQLWPTE